MKALTILPPYAMAIWARQKDIEYRTWQTAYRGDILITSSSRRFRDCVCGYALCVAELYDITKRMRRDIDTDTLFWAGEYEWHLRNVRPIKPFPIKGKLNLWETEKVGVTEANLEFLPRYPEDGATEETENAWFDEFIQPIIYAPRKR